MFSITIAGTKRNCPTEISFPLLRRKDGRLYPSAAKPGEAPASPWVSSIRGDRRRSRRASFGRVPRWTKGEDCKSAGMAFAGSNPASSTKENEKGRKKDEPNSGTT